MCCRTAPSVSPDRCLSQSLSSSGIFSIGLRADMNHAWRTGILHPMLLGHARSGPLPHPSLHALNMALGSQGIPCLAHLPCDFHCNLTHPGITKSGCMTAPCRHYLRSDQGKQVEEKPLPKPHNCSRQHPQHPYTRSTYGTVYRVLLSTCHPATSNT